MAFVFTSRVNHTVQTAKTSSTASDVAAATSQPSGVTSADSSRIASASSPSIGKEEQRTQNAALTAAAKPTAEDLQKELEREKAKEKADLARALKAERERDRDVNKEVAKRLAKERAAENENVIKEKVAAHKLLATQIVELKKSAALDNQSRNWKAAEEKYRQCNDKELMLYSNNRYYFKRIETLASIVDCLNKEGFGNEYVMKNVAPFMYEAATIYAKSEPSVIQFVNGRKPMHVWVPLAFGARRVANALAETSVAEQKTMAGYCRDFCDQAYPRWEGPKTNLEFRAFMLAYSGAYATLGDMARSREVEQRFQADTGTPLLLPEKSSRPSRKGFRFMQNRRH